MRRTQCRTCDRDALPHGLYCWTCSGVVQAKFLSRTGGVQMPRVVELTEDEAV